MPGLSEVLYWAACWIAVTVAILGLAAWLTGSNESYFGVITFFSVATAIWIVGRLSLWLSSWKRPRTRRP
jgi:hypothetical protein